MSPIAPGDVVRYREPFPQEKGLLMVITEWNIDRGYGKPLFTGMRFPGLTLLREKDIEVVGTIHDGRIQQSQAV